MVATRIDTLTSRPWQRRLGAMTWSPISMARSIFISLGAVVMVSQQSHAHPGSGIAVDSQERIFFTAGPKIVMIGTNGQVRTIVHDKKNEKFYQLHHIQRAPDGGLLTASDMGNAIWRFSPEGKLSQFYPPVNEDRPLRVGFGGDPFAVDREGTVDRKSTRLNSSHL